MRGIRRLLLPAMALANKIQLKLKLYEPVKRPLLSLMALAVKILCVVISCPLYKVWVNGLGNITIRYNRASPYLQVFSKRPLALKLYDGLASSAYPAIPAPSGPYNAVLKLVSIRLDYAGLSLT